MAARVPFDGLLILSYGGPNGEAEVGPFLDRILAGRPISPERRRQVEEKYRLFLGKSPLVAECGLLAERLTEALEKAGFPNGAIRLEFGNLYAKPSISDAVEAFYRAGRRAVLAVIAHPFGSAQSFDRYRDALAQSVADVEKKRKITEISPEKIEFALVPPWYEEPAFSRALADSLLELWAADRLREDLWTGQTGTPFDTMVLFSAHSLPISDAERSGYDRQVLAVCRRIARETGLGARLSEKSPPAESFRAKNEPPSGEPNDAPPWELVWQSRSGRPSEPWLGPEIGPFVAEQSEKSTDFRRLLVVPVGFLLENMETVGDLDTELAEQCRALGITFRRSKTIGTTPEIAEMIVGFLKNDRVVLANRF